MFQTMGRYLVGAGFPDGASMPGRPIADPGPDRVVKQGATPLSAAMSLYASSYQWSVVSGPVGGAVLANATTASPIFTASQDGAYGVQLVVSNSSGTASTPVSLTMVVNSSLPYTPSALRFADIKPVLQSGVGQCENCHKPGGDGTVIAPVWYADYDRAATGNAADATNALWLYTEAPVARLF